MNHQFIIDAIIKNNGIILGGYVREWIGNLNPSDYNWQDIDIRCPKDSIEKIKKEIYSLYPNLILDFSPNEYNEYRSPYSCNLIQYDGQFKTVKYLGKENYVNLARKKICVYLKNISVGRKLDLEKKLIDQGWKIQYPYLIKP